MASKLQRLGKEEIARRIKVKRKIARKRKIKSFLAKSLLYSSLAGNVYYVSKPHHLLLLTNISETWQKIAPILENLANKLPL